MIDWKRKLTSRKFWVAVAEFVTMLILAFGGKQETTVQVTALIMASATVVAYIIGEGLTDAAAVKTPTIHAIIPDEFMDDPEDESDEPRAKD